ncbi:MAG: MTH1187 family thiamine-binding protein, partial [Planctomycetota bacterium]
KLKTHLHAYGTNVEGEWDDVFAAVKKCHEAVHGMGAPRVSTVIKVGTRIDRDQTMSEKVSSVETKLEDPA